MNKNDYLKELKKHLKHMNKEEKEDIHWYYTIEVDYLVC